MTTPVIRLASKTTAVPPVCPILTLGLLQPPSALVTNAPSTIPTAPCLGPRCAFFHGAGACSILVAGDALLAQAHAMLDTRPDEKAVNETEAPKEN